MKKIHVFYEPELLEVAKEHILKNPELHKQISRVLKLHPGETIICTNGKGLGVKYKIKYISLKDIELTEGINISKEVSEKRTTLVCAVPKHNTFEYIVEKTTELGVNKIVPVISERTVKTNINIDRVKKIAKEAMEQSERYEFPIIEEKTKFLDCLKDISTLEEEQNKIICDANGMSTEKYISRNDLDTILCIGPEGGWTEEELLTAEGYGFVKVKISDHILKTDTAAIAAIFWTKNNKNHP